MHTYRQTRTVENLLTHRYYNQSYMSEISISKHLSERYMQYKNNYILLESYRRQFFSKLVTHGQETCEVIE